MTSSLIFWEVLTFVVLLAVFLLTFSAIRRRRNRLRELSESSADDASAEETLDKRYANGEISREEYQTIRDDITRKQNA